MPRRTLLATTAALLISSGCNDESAVDEYGSSDGEAETSGDSQPPEVVGRWRTAGATATRTCGDDPIVVLPVPPLPAVEFTHAAGALTATLPDGCTVTMEAVESGATLVDDPGCTVQGPTGPFEQQLSAFTVTVRNEAEASLTLHADQQVDGRACEFEIIGDLTREDAERPAVEVVAEFGQGVFVEGIERDDDGTTWVTASQPDGSGLWRVPMDGDPEFVVAYPAGATGTLVRDAAGTLWTTLGSFDPAFVPALARLDGDRSRSRSSCPRVPRPTASRPPPTVRCSSPTRIWVGSGGSIRRPTNSRCGPKAEHSRSAPCRRASDFPVRTGSSSTRTPSTSPTPPR